MNGIRKLMCSIACCFMILGNAPINIYAAEEDPTIEATMTETLANEPEQNPEVLSTQPSQDPSTQDPSIQDPSTDPESEEEPEEEIKEGETTETPSADLGVATALMMAGASTYRGQSGNGQNGNGQNGNHDGNSGGKTGAHIDVRIAASLTIESKVNGITISSETVSVDTSNVLGSFNGTPVSFTRKYGQGIENEWRASISQLTPSTDKISISCTLTGTKTDGEKINIPFSMDYSGAATLNQFKTNCPNHTGYDINIVANDISESFTVNRTIQKVWDDDNNANNTRPDNISVQLFADNEVYGEPITISKDNNWQITIENLPKYSSGNKEIYYSAEEINIPAGYSSFTSCSGQNITITNTYRVEQTQSITVRKVWDDKNNQDGIRPNSIKVYLMDNEVSRGEVILSEENHWTHTFTGLDANKEYRVVEYKDTTTTALNEYTTTYSGSMQNGFIIKNSYTPETIEKLNVKKVWDDNNDQDGLRPKSIYVYLYANGNYYDKIILNEENDWSGSFENLPKKSNGEDIKYTIKEPALDGYTSKVTGDVDNGFTVTNTQVYDSITVKKEWNDNNNHDGLRPEEVYIYLIGKVTTDDRVIFLAYDEQISLNDTNNWTYSYLDHPVYYEGHKIEYILHEGEVDNYTTEITGDAEKGFIVTNTEVKDITVQKVWNDNDDFYGKRPDEITVALFANGKEVSAIQVKEIEDWTATFEDVPVYENGNKIKYEVYEKYTIDNDDYKYYDSYVEEDENGGFIITNTFNYFSFTVRKVWNDQNDKDGIRPEKVQFELYQNGKLKDTFTLSERNDWDIDFTVHAFDDDGNVIEYSVIEINVADGYTSKVTGSALDDFTITNTHEITKKEDPKNEETKTNNTNTGVVSSFRSNILLLTLSSIGLFFFNKKRK